MKRFSTTSDFINNHVRSGGFPAGEVVEMLGYNSSGDQGAALWKSTGLTIAASQTVIDTNDIKISDASGNEFELVHIGIIDLNALGGTGGAYVTIATNAGLTWSQSFTSIPSNAKLSFSTVAEMAASPSLSIGDKITITERGEVEWIMEAPTTNNGWDKLDASSSGLTARYSPSREINLRELGLSLLGSSDERNAAQNAIDLALSEELPLNGTYGTLRIDSALDKITEDFTFYSDQKGSFRIRRNYTEADATRGVLHAESGTQSWRDIYIEAEAGTTGGAGFSLVATASTSPDFSVLENVLATGLSGTGTFAHPIYVDGSARTGSPLGVRDLAVINGDFFAGTTHIGFFKSVNNTKLLGAQFFSAGGTATTVRVDGTASSPSNTFLLSSTFVADLQVDRLSKGVFNIANSINSITNTVSVTNALIIASSVTTYQTNWVRSQVFANDATTEFNAGNLLIRDSNGSATNNLELTYNGATGVAHIGPQAGGNTEMELRTTTSGTYRATHKINKDGSWIFLTTQTAASAANSSLFVDSADNKLKYKDSGGTTNVLY